MANVPPAQAAFVRRAMLGGLLRHVLVFNRRYFVLRVEERVLYAFANRRARGVRRRQRLESTCW